ncbi:porin [Cupriavidus lacunae]|uniref:porin n=1 Tax=Cupriavidus lacunae TaxID=2666307 RepID=UPI001FC97B8C|nr:porin [Cupriavidus lacunae]
MPLAMAGVLAVVGCGASQQALAQPAASSVSVYGLIDTMVRYSDNNRGDQRLAELSEGYFSGSRWGVRGIEALGAGWSALFDLESGFDLATGASLQGTAAPNYGQVGTQGTGRLFGRQSFLGLEHQAWGKLTFGRQFTTAYDATFRFQHYGHPNLDAVAILNGYTGPRQDNMAKYAGKWGALSAAAHYTFGEVPGDAAPPAAAGAWRWRGPRRIDVGALEASGCSTATWPWTTTTGARSLQPARRQQHSRPRTGGQAASGKHRRPGLPLPLDAIPAVVLGHVRHVVRAHQQRFKVLFLSGSILVMGAVRGSPPPMDAIRQTIVNNLAIPACLDCRIRQGCEGWRMPDRQHL